MSSPDGGTALLEKHADAVEAALDRYLPPDGGEFARLAGAMRYSVFAGGKRLRPSLVLECCRVAGGNIEDAMPAACATEMIHTYSLIHDDLPAMDDDDLRRGRPSCHVAFDEATAILAGDALQALAFEVAAQTPGDAVAKEVVLTLARAVGPYGLVGGQLLDLEATGQEATMEQVGAIHDHKTADLIAGCCHLGGLVGRGKQDEMAEALDNFGRNLGHAFQIADDILDVTSSAEELGKTPGKDEAAAKATYTAIAGLDGARRRARRYRDAAIAALGEVGDGAESLRDLADFVVERKS